MSRLRGAPAILSGFEHFASAAPGVAVCGDAPVRARGARLLEPALTCWNGSLQDR